MNNLKSPLLKNNTFLKFSLGVFIDPNSKTVLKTPTDKIDSNARDIHEIIKNSKDMSSFSAELDSKWVYWPTEYHLNSMRSNLLRGLNLKNIHTALELGAGCGVISRYLGELGVQVDAVEARREYAEIIKLRCHDLNNVQVFNISLDEATLPERTYDAIFLIDVIEYPSQVISDANNHLCKVISLLNRLKASLQKNGVIVIAAPNRMGLKYWLGASDKGYDKAYVGLDGYPNDPRFKNYDRNEWESILKRTELPYYKFFYPFPDHLLTRVLLSDHFITSDKYAHSVLYHIKSRDYLNPKWDPEDDEYLRWETLGRSGYLADFANSFLIIASESQVMQNSPYDFIHFSNQHRKREYRTVTYKLRDDENIYKNKVITETAQPETTSFFQKLEENQYIRGPLLVSEWLHALLSNNTDAEFKRCLVAYFEFIKDRLQDPSQSSGAFDWLPFNMIVNLQGEYSVFDTEWRSEKVPEPEFIFFRALLWFGYTHPILIDSFCKPRELFHLGDFILHGFELVSVKIEDRLERFIFLEEQFHQKIASDHSNEPVKQLVYQPFQHVNTLRISKTYTSQLYWVGKNNALENTNSVTASAQLGNQSHTLYFRMPPNVTEIQKLRFDPADRPGFFHLFGVKLEWLDANGKCDDVLWELDNARQIADQAIMHDVYFCPSAMIDVFLSTSEDPRMIFELPYLIKSPSPNGVFLFKVKMSWPKSADYLAAVEKIKYMALEINARDELIAEKEKRMVEYHAKLQEFDLKDVRITELIDQLSERDAKIAILEYKMNLIEKSGLGKIFKVFKGSSN